MIIHITSFKLKYFFQFYGNQVHNESTLAYLLSSPFLICVYDSLVQFNNPVHVGGSRDE